MRLPVASYDQPGRNATRLVNVYPQASSGKGPVELIGSPGIVPFASLGAGPGRGMFVMRGILYAVSGTKLYKVDEFGSEIELGTIPGSVKCTFAGNGVEIVIGPSKHIFSNGAVTAITDPDLPAIIGVAETDGFVVYTESGSGKWGASLLYDGASYDGLDYASAEAYPDDLVCPPVVDHRQVLLFGQESLQIYWNSGHDGFPFEALAGSFIEYGCLAQLGTAKQDNSVFWIANDRTIRRLAGQTPMRVSHHGMEEKLSNYGRLDDCQAFAWNWNGHLFVAFRFPSEGAAWIYDVTTSEWHERDTYGQPAWDVIDAVQCYGKTFMQSASTGAIGSLSDGTHTDFGGILRRYVTYPIIYDAQKRVYHSQLDIVMRTGDAEAGVTPYVNLDYSDDGGSTFTQLPGRQLVPRGTTGEYSQVVRFTRLGMARDRVYRVWSSDAAPFIITDTVLQAASGAP